MPKRAKNILSYPRGMSSLIIVCEYYIVWLESQARLALLIFLTA